ncbi:hypothetical protein KJ903_02980 [Patescibacteria group bacterium]|nr:hypothetical protein [Patescibacteria group bacterium]
MTVTGGGIITGGRRWGRLATARSAARRRTSLKSRRGSRRSSAAIRQCSRQEMAMG